MKRVRNPNANRGRFEPGFVSHTFALDHGGQRVELRPESPGRSTAFNEKDYLAPFFVCLREFAC
jgi:hypothetical protein